MKRVILCVDDDINLLRSLKEEIRSIFGFKYEIEIAQSSEEALELVKELQDDGYIIALVIADYIMPGMKGDELLKKIHGISPNTVKIMLSGQASIEGVVNSINEAKLFRYLDKSWDREEIERIIKEAFFIFEKKKDTKKLENSLISNDDMHRTLVRVKSNIDSVKKNSGLNVLKNREQSKVFEKSINEIASIIEDIDDRKK